MSEQNKPLVTRFVDQIWNRKNLNKLEEFLSNQYSAQTPDGMIRGLQEYRQFHAGYLEAFPDCRLTVDELLSEGNTVACRMTFTGTHTGELRGIPATGKPVREQCIALLKMAGGKITEEVAIWDRVSFYEQLGVAPETMKQATRKAGR